MAKRTRTSRARTTFVVTCVLAVIVAVPWLLPGCSSCRLDTSPLRPHPPVESDDSDSGDDHK